MTNPNTFDGMGDELSSMARDILNTKMDLYKKYLGEKIKSQNIMNYNGANTAYNHARNTAKGLGLDDNGINPYPGKDKTLVISDTQAPMQTETPEKPKSLFSKLKPVLLGAALGAGTLGGGAAALPYLANWIVSYAHVQEQPKEPVPEVKPQPVEPHGNGDVGISIE